MEQTQQRKSPRIFVTFWSPWQYIFDIQDVEHTQLMLTHKLFSYIDTFAHCGHMLIKNSYGGVAM